MSGDQEGSNGSSSSNSSSQFQTEIDSLSHELVLLKNSLALLAKTNEAKNRSGLKCKEELEKADRIMKDVKKVNDMHSTKKECPNVEG